MINLFQTVSVLVVVVVISTFLFSIVTIGGVYGGYGEISISEGEPIGVLMDEKHGVDLSVQAVRWAAITNSGLVRSEFDCEECLTPANEKVSVSPELPLQHGGCVRQL